LWWVFWFFLSGSQKEQRKNVPFKSYISLNTVLQFFMSFLAWWRIKIRQILPDNLLKMQKAGRINEVKNKLDNIHVHDIQSIIFLKFVFYG